MTNRADSSDAIYLPGPPKWTIDALIQKLQTLLRNRVDEAYLFGSYARGTANADSDIDLIVVTPTEARWPRRAEAFADLWDHLGPIDVLVYRPDEWTQMHATHHSFLDATAEERINIFRDSGSKHSPH